jgi:hypothetical protein
VKEIAEMYAEVWAGMGIKERVFVFPLLLLAIPCIALTMFLFGER